MPALRCWSAVPARQRRRVIGHRGWASCMTGPAVLAMPAFALAPSRLLALRCSPDSKNILRWAATSAVPGWCRGRSRQESVFITIPPLLAGHLPRPGAAMPEMEQCGEFHQFCSNTTVAAAFPKVCTQDAADGAWRACRPRRPRGAALCRARGLLPRVPEETAGQAAEEAGNWAAGSAWPCRCWTEHAGPTQTPVLASHLRADIWPGCFPPCRQQHLVAPDEDVVPPVCKGDLPVQGVGARQQ